MKPFTIPFSIRFSTIVLLGLLAGNAFAQSIGPVTRHAGDRSDAVLGTTPGMDACVAAVAATRQIGECRALVTPVIGLPLPVVIGSSWRGAGEQGQVMKARPDMRLAYGVDRTWLTRWGETASPCTAEYFGGDPAPGKRKRCLVLTPETVATTPPPVTRPEVPVTPAEPVPGVNVTASRTSGVAPLAVLFSVTGDSTAKYSFDFGDRDAGTWAVSRRPKNSEEGGPVQAHVYETPGTYTATVAGQRITITVQDPAAVLRTVCVSGRSDWAGCPEGATRQTALPSSYSGLRVLLHRGESFAGIRPAPTHSGFQVGAYGTGAKPQTSVFTGTPGANGVVTSDWTVMDLDLNSINIDASTQRFLALRNDVARWTGGDSMVNIGTAATYYQSHGHAALQWPREVFLVENTILGTVGTSRSTAPNVTVMGFLYKSALLGNTIDRAFEHSVRIWAGDTGVMAHNAIGGTHNTEGSRVGIRHAFKMHSAGTGPWADRISASGPAVATSRIVFAHNRIGTPQFPGSWLVGIGPQNADAGTVEGLQDVIAEGNTFVRGPNTVSEIQWRGRRMTARGNVLQGGGTPSIVRNGSRYDARLGAWDGPYSVTP